LREQLCERANAEGAQALHDELMSVDPKSAAAIHPNNVKRVVRALEIYYSCGIPKSELDERSKELEPRYDASVIGLYYPKRDILYTRIERRVEAMIDGGLLLETERLMNEGVFLKNSTAAQAIGYKELLGYLRGEQSLEDAVDELKTATRRYAKRQITWFSAKPYVMALEASDENGVKRFEEIVNNAEKLFSL
jgi:tRNA dimethylallyltransferase